MGKRRIGNQIMVVPVARPLVVNARHVRTRWSLPSFAFLVSLCFVIVPIVDPSAAFAMNAVTVSAPAPVGPGQSVTATGEAALTAARGDYTIKPPPPPPPTSSGSAARPAGKPDPGTAKAIAYDMVMARGWDESQYSCLVSLWQRESGWNVYATNKSSGAYGIPQALPGVKMATAGADWQTSAATQITWGLGYITARYGTPCGAWAHSESHNWY